MVKIIKNTVKSREGRWREENCGEEVRVTLM
jgi:hypothetical protein